MQEQVKKWLFNFSLVLKHIANVVQDNEIKKMRKAFLIFFSSLKSEKTEKVS